MDKIKEVFERFPKVEELYHNQSTGECYFHEVKGSKRILRSDLLKKQNEIKKQKKQK